MNDERIFYELSRGNGYSKMRCSDERVDIFFSSFFMMERLGRASYSEYVLWFCPSVNSPRQENSRRGGLFCLVVRNHVILGVSLRVLYCVMDAGLGRSQGDCRPALPKH